MSPEAPAPDPSVPDPSASDPSESYPFWGYLDLAGFVIIAVLALFIDSALARVFLSLVHVKEFFVELPAQFLLYALLLWMLSVIFRRYYGRPFWESLRWVPAGLSAPVLATCGILLAFAVMAASLLLKTRTLTVP